MPSFEEQVENREDNGDYHCSNKNSVICAAEYSVHISANLFFSFVSSFTLPLYFQYMYFLGIPKDSVNYSKTRNPDSVHVVSSCKLYDIVLLDRHGKKL